MAKKYFLALLIFTITNIFLANQLVKCTVKRVIDSETIIIIANEDTDIFQKDKEYRITLAGVSTQPLTNDDQSYAQKTLEYIAKALTYKTVYLELHEDTYDKYGRINVYIWLEPPTSKSEEKIKTKLFNYLLVSDGYASVIDNEPKVKYLQHLLSAEQIARYMNYGIWAPSDNQEFKNIDNESTTTIPPQPTETTTQVSVEITKIIYKGENEQVIIQNTGNTSVNMKGWKLVSVKGKQIFYFPYITLQPGQSITICSGPGASGTSGTLIWSKAYLWNDKGDEAQLINPAGEIVSWYAY